MDNFEHNNSFIALDEVVNQVLSELDAGNDGYFKCYQLGLRCLRDLHSSFTGEFKEVQLEMLANGTALLPDDYVNDIGVGLINPRGEFFALRKSKIITRNLETDCDRLGQNTVGGQTFPFTGNRVDRLDNNVYNGYTVAGSYGVGSDLDYGTYDIDAEAGLILFDFRVNSASYSNIVLRYLPMFGLDGEIYMPSMFVETVVKFIIHRFIAHKRNVSAYDKNEAKRDYLNERQNLRYKLRRVNFAQIIAESRRSMRSSPRS